MIFKIKRILEEIMIPAASLRLSFVASQSLPTGRQAFIVLFAIQQTINHKLKTINTRYG